MIVLGAYFVAVLMGSWICDYLAMPQFAEITSELGTFSHLYLYSLVIGLVVMMLCLAIIWIVLSRICKRTQALESGMRRSHNHWLQYDAGCAGDDQHVLPGCYFLPPVLGGQDG